MQEKVGSIFRCLLKISKLESFKDKGLAFFLSSSQHTYRLSRLHIDKTASEPDLNYLNIFFRKSITRQKKKGPKLEKRTERKKEKG